jgi:hypothetical protein
MNFGERGIYETPDRGSIDGVAYRPLKAGFLFSRKAAIPSF